MNLDIATVERVAREARADFEAGQLLVGLYGEYCANIDPRLFVSDALARLLVADITCDQFGGPKVYVGPLVEPWSLDQPSAY